VPGDHCRVEGVVSRGGQFRNSPHHWRNIHFNIEFYKLEGDLAVRCGVNVRADAAIVAAKALPICSRIVGTLNQMDSKCVQNGSRDNCDPLPSSERSFVGAKSVNVLFIGNSVSSETSAITDSFHIDQPRR
jgi:hypothetical protein